MGRIHHSIAPIMIAMVLGVAPARAGGLDVRLDENTIVNLRAPAGNVVVGNPGIADVSLINPHRMAILGRSYGLTNVIVLDQMGHTIFRQEINVAAAASGRVSVYRGPLVSNFACSPHCERTPMPGEEKTSNYDPFSNGYKDYDERSRTDAGGGAAGTPGSP